jgi:hypothetical protein
MSDAGQQGIQYQMGYVQINSNAAGAVKHLTINNTTRDFLRKASGAMVAVGPSLSTGSSSH